MYIHTYLSTYYTYVFTHIYAHTYTYTHRCSNRPPHAEIFPHVGNDIRSNRFIADKKYLTGNFPGTK